MKATMTVILGRMMLFGLALALAACAQATPVPPDTPTSLPNEDAGASPALTWERVGGVAGFCDGVSIYADGRVIATTCEGKPVKAEKISSERQAQLETWINRFAAFDWEQTDPATADAMTVRISFAGEGSEMALDADQRAIADLAAAVFARVAMDAGGGASTPTPLPGVMPVPDAGRAYDAARDALIAQLGIELSTMAQVEITEEVWRDSCLGLPEEGEMCATVLTPGFRVVVDVNGTQYVVRTNRDSSTVRVVEGEEDTDPTGYPTRRVAWEDAVTLIQEGDVEQVFQTHALEVTLTLKDGSVVTTIEPSIDEVFAVVQACGEVCSDIVLVTE